MMLSRERRFSIILIALLSLATPLLGQSTEADIKARLKGKSLYIRNFWSDDRLHYDANGDLSVPSKRTVFTLSGFSFLSLKLKNGLLVLSGKPVAIEFLKDGPKRVDLPYPDRTIEIAAPANGDLGPALDAIFADGIESLAPSLPPYWQAWAHKTYPDAYPPETAAAYAKATLAGSSALKKIGGPVLPPKILKRVDAQLNTEAKSMGLSVTSLIDVIVEPDGEPSQIAVVSPAGLGLDERAMSAVSLYKFAPATENGLPVPVEINIEINFR